ncbi:hypothetical protein MFLAVUS_005330 [Mucor flavus]|uniref:DUF2423 domain-containing protein n=1 Tax=Mucor flavus TaxID=439312 RepID=A0ABP9YYE5_9FUNG
MARSLRSQHKKRTRAIKREFIFKPVEDARLERLSAAQAEAANKPSVGDFMEKEEEESAPVDKMVEEEATEEDKPKKISTSGPRSNRHARKLKEKKKKGKKGNNKF